MDRCGIFPGDSWSLPFVGGSGRLWVKLEFFWVVVVGAL